ncbi:MAG: DinB family protein [Bacteroidota bacterium]|nr:DinB family protein [Bacteroidota bacterium]
MINRPHPDEFAPFYAKYVNLVGEGPILDIMERLEDETYAFFMGVTTEKADYAYAEGKWTVKELLGHMIDAERTFAYRVLCFSREETELPGFDQDVYMLKATFKSRSLADLANEFKAVRDSNLYLFRSLSDAQQTQKGIASGNPVSVRALIYIIAGHELHHMNILRERYVG